MIELSDRWSVTSGRHHEYPETEHGKKVDREYDTSEPNIAGQDLDRRVQHPACDKEPSQHNRSRTGLGVQQEQEAGSVEEQRPLELIGQVGTDARLDACPRVAAIRPAADTPDRRCARNGEQDIEERRKSDMCRHGHDQRLRRVCIHWLNASTMPRRDAAA